MLKLKRFLLPFSGMLLVAVVLLFVQAICDLNLPNLMSDIVNTGIQQGGVEDATPRALSKGGRQFIQTFMSEDDRQLLDQNYTLKQGVEKDADGRELQVTWPKAIDDAIYILDDNISEQSLEQLDQVFGSATWTMVNLLQHVKQARDDESLEGIVREQAEALALAEIEKQLRESGTELPPGVSVEQMAQQLLEQQLAAESGNATGGNAAGGNSAGGNAAAGNSAALFEFPDASELDAAAGGDSENTDLQQLDFAKIYEFQPLLDLLPDSWYEEARTQAGNTDPSLRAQSGTMLVAGFYRELGRDMGAIELSYILRIGLLMLLITAISGIATILVGFISARVGAGLARNLRKAVFEKVSGFSHAEFDRFSTASLITRTTNDVMMMQMLLTMGVRMLCYAPIIGIGGTVMALSKSVSMSWIIGVAVVVLLGIIAILAAVVMPKFRIIQTLVDRLNLVARESLVGLMVVRAFSRSDFEKNRFDVANSDLTRVNLFVNRAMVFMMPIMMLFMNGLSVLIIWVGAQQVAASQMQVGDMMAYMQYVMQIMMAFMFIAMIFVFVPRAQVSANRIAEVLDTKPTISDPDQPLAIDEAKRGEVEFRDVSFRYEGAQADAIEHITFTARPGQTTAFIGSTGSGKSTIINLIPRFYDASSGEVLVGGVNVRELAQSDLRSRIGYVPQKSVLMAGTIASNIAYGAKPDDMQKVAEVAQAADFIQELPDAFESPISQAGANVSGGQRQRLSIARALAIKPDIYLFDDSFSALDFTTDAALRRALSAYTANATMIIIAQRVSTIMDADQIFVIDDGKIVGQGSHQELLETCEPYAQIASTQLALKPAATIGSSVEDSVSPTVSALIAAMDADRGDGNE